MHAIVVNGFGGPDVLTSANIAPPYPGAGQVVVEVAVSGVNFLDVYQRRGQTSLAAPYTAGVEGVGTVVELGEGVEDFAVGDRVGWFSGGQGSFADYAAVDVARAVPLPASVDDQTATAVMLQGVTAHYLACDTYPIRSGDTVVVHAAAGGVGQLLTQVAKIRGATVIGTVSTTAKAQVALAAGADHAVAYSDLPAVVADVTSGRGVAAVYDGVGRATFETSLAVLGVRGVYVVYGTASGPTPPLEIPALNSGGSLYVTRPTVVDYTRTPQELRARTDDVFGWIADGRLKVDIGIRYAMTEVIDAFTAMESRRTSGKALLVHEDRSTA